MNMGFNGSTEMFNSGRQGTLEEQAEKFKVVYLSIRFTFYKTLRSNSRNRKINNILHSTLARIMTIIHNTQEKWLILAGRRKRIRKSFTEKVQLLLSHVLGQKQPPKLPHFLLKPPCLHQQIPRKILSPVLPTLTQYLVSPLHLDCRTISLCSLCLF
jgi:hypothetical protein